jgi:hypothetical protein
MKTKIIGIVLLASASMVTGQTYFGGYDCGEWFTKPHSKTWLLGYLSGVNVGTVGQMGFPLNYDPLGKLNSSEQAYLWMDNYCRANPLKTVLDGALHLYNELRAKK